MKNSEIVTRFFEFYGKRDFEALATVLSKDVTWYFLGNHKLAGTKTGIHELVEFFDIMGKIMGKSNPTVDKLLVSETGKFLIECQHITTNRQDGINIDHFVTVLWTIEDGKIVSGRHFFADPTAVDAYFNAVAP